MDLSTLPLVVLQTLTECVDPESLVYVPYTEYRSESKALPFAVYLF